jgi:PAS domain S-box-containing protein
MQAASRVRIGIGLPYRLAVGAATSDRKKRNGEAALELARRTGRAESEGSLIRKDGYRFWANVVINALKDGEGRLLGFGKIVRDMTDRKRAMRPSSKANNAS